MLFWSKIGQSQNDFNTNEIRVVVGNFESVEKLQTIKKTKQFTYFKENIYSTEVDCIPIKKLMLILIILT